MYRKIILSTAGLLLTAITYAQAPDMYPPTVPERVDVNPLNIILYIVLPIALVVIFFWYQRSQKKKNRQKLDERDKQIRRK